MTNVRLFSVIAVSVVVTALVMGAVTRPAHADTPRTAECKYKFDGKDGEQVAATITTWMNAEIAAGRTQFVVVSSLVICAS